MNLKKKRDYFSLIFDIGMMWRIIYGALQLVFGIILLNFIDINFNRFFYLISGHNLIGAQNHFLVKSTQLLLGHHPVKITYFLASYFIFWGILDIFLAVNLLRLKLWAYPTSLFLITFFTIYEAYRFIHTHSVLLFLIIIFDSFIIWLINKEYKKLKKIHLKKEEEEIITSIKNFLKPQ